VSDVVITDVLPAYLQYESSQPTATRTPFGSSPPRDSLYWKFTNVNPLDSRTVLVKATPVDGVCASQPLFANRAWVTLSDTMIPTNYTYHQGAGVCLIAFSAGYGGQIYHATEQAIDYRSTPRSGIVIVPNEGYQFAGWSHSDYVSLRGERIAAQSRIMRYDTLTVFGNMTLHAEFELRPYPITYHLHGGLNAADNPPAYTLESGDVILSAPAKAGDEFIGWTGSNGDVPQLSVTIPAGSTGDREYIANYRHSGHAIDAPPSVQDVDRVWAVDNWLHVYNAQSGSILRIYSTSGVLLQQQSLLHPGETKRPLTTGMYVVTLNNGLGTIVIIP
jgi:uncharacterized repeat protein (TIGR02543 family)